MDTKKQVEKWARANELHHTKGTTRAWLREMWSAGKVRRRVLVFHAPSGEERVQYLYAVEDVEQILAATEREDECDNENEEDN